EAGGGAGAVGVARLEGTAGGGGHRSSRQQHLAHGVATAVRDPEAGPIVGDAEGLVEPRSRTYAVGRSGLTRDTGDGGHHARGDDDLADRVIARVGDEQVGAVGGDAL